MTTAPFDTLKLATALREKAHFTAEQAEGITRAFGDAFEERITTREDIEQLDTKIDQLNARVEAKLEALELRLTIKLGTIVIVGIGAVTAIVKFIHA